MLFMLTHGQVTVVGNSSRAWVGHETIKEDTFPWAPAGGGGKGGTCPPPGI